MAQVEQPLAVAAASAALAPPPPPPPAAHAPSFFFIFLQVIDVVVSATNARPIRVAWRDAEGSHEVPLGALHRIVAWDPPLGLAPLGAVRDWESACVVSGVWVSSRQFRPKAWARM